ncbi:MAG TPA: 16S rRNA (uracil(1498)-N(3))-methyltransferase [Anaeromyxobacteraceae bacterium]|nr:16S rRNA (uracil(1498)-N(3))-methyltransferase [Anaeromyxobacteraceae bacterium]
MSRRLHVPRERIEAGRARLGDDDLHYLRDVLRLEPGAALEVFDGEGGAYDARLSAAGELELGPRREAPRPAARIALAFALARGEKGDLVVQKATELGAAALHPFEAERSVVRLDPQRGEERARRWRKIAAEAARQCGRSEVPEVSAPATLTAALSAAPAGWRKVVFHETGGVPLASALDPAAPGHLVVTGPEGGLSARELAECSAAGAHVATMGPRVLRAETAAIAAVALLQHRLGDLI